MGLFDALEVGLEILALLRLQLIKDGMGLRVDHHTSV